MKSKLSANRWILRRVTAHVSRPFTPFNSRLACPQAAFRIPLGAQEAGKLRRAASGLQQGDGAPSPTSLTRLIAPDAHPAAGLGRRQARVQVSAHAPLLNGRLSRH